ncbi:MAG TPA: RagB/SusD family nutrient uptake outer membrane protein [Chitinophagaceae bacterium]|nr:RagB/SusD family nutrient uptake outer membrane protein [Chitinophagaceae bacterium]
MNALNKITVLLAIVLSLGSCKKYLDLAPISNQSTASFYKSESDIDQALAGTYNVLLAFPDVNNYNLSECRSNNFYLASVDAQRDYYTINHFQVNSQLAMLETAWTNDYKLIGRANQVLDAIDNITFLDSTKRKREKAEARFLRAYSYFELVKAFGAVPLIQHAINSDEALNYGRVGIDTIYSFITSELQAASADLPYKYTTAADKGRATKLAALGMLGRAYMFMAGYPMNKTQYYQDAQTAFQQVLAQENVNWVFSPTYAALFKAANDNAYHLFEVQYISGGQGYGSPIPGEVVPTDMTTQLLPFGAYYISGEPSPDLIGSYETGDVREFLTLDTLYRNKSNVVTRRSWVRKYLDSSVASTTKSSSDWPVNFPLLRSEDVMLMYAEATNEISGPNAAITGILNRIRTRAGLPSIFPPTQDSLRTAIRKERRHEFAWEGIYWYDLVRTNQYLPVMNPWLQTYYQKTIDQTQYIYPIPQPEMNIKPGLYYPNPGY